MAQWTNKDEANGAPKYTVDATTGRSGIQEYGNTVFGQKPTEKEVGAASPGWVRTVKGEAVITGIVVKTGGTGYANGETVTVGEVEGNVVTNASGAITNVAITFDTTKYDELPEVEVDTEAGEGATFELTYNGPLGRVWVETLVAMRGITD